MQTIGERLEEARKRKGVSIREAAEATKIRGDYLHKFESNQFDIRLPDIYVRGFLRTYANFLKLPGDKVVNDFLALGLIDSKGQRPINREVYGRMDLSVASKSAAAAKGTGAAASPEDRPGNATPPAGNSDDRNPATFRPRAEGGAGLDKQILIKIGVIAGGGVLLLVLVIWGIVALTSSSPTTPSTQPERAAAPTPTPAPSAAGFIALHVTEPAIRLKVVRMSDGAELFQATVEKGFSMKFPDEILLLTASKLEAVRIEYRGKFFTTGYSGYGRIEVDPAVLK